MLKKIYKKIPLKYRAYLHTLYPFKYLLVAYRDRRHLLSPIKHIQKTYRYRIFPDEYIIREQYKRIFGNYPDLQHPKTLNEKIQWLKLNNKTPLQTICADKYKVRDYIKNKVGSEYLVPQVFTTKNVEDICGENMPDYPVIIKTNHDSAGEIIIRNKQHQNWQKIRKQLQNKIARNYYYSAMEWQYKNIERRIIVEQLLTDKNGNIPADYKVYCFNGTPNIIEIVSDRQKNVKSALYSVKWERLDVKLVYASPMGDIKRPLHLDTMLKTATTLATDFICVRVDFYVLAEKLYISELTFTPQAGYVPFSPPKWDLELGSRLKLPTIDD